MDRPIAAGTLTRRGALAAGVGALLGAATARWPGLASAASRASAPELLPLGADVWALSLGVQGTPANARLTAAGRPVPTARQDGGFQALVAVGPGATTVEATSPDGRASSSIFVGRVPDRPTARVSLSVVADSVWLDASPTERDPYTTAPIESVTWSRRDGGAALGTGTELALSGPWADGEQYVTARVTDANGRSDDTTVVFVVSEGRPVAIELGEWQARWVQGAVVYGAVPPLFGEPPLEALTASLDRLVALGVNVLWLAPVFATVPGDFGYAVTDHFSVRSDYGDLAALQALVAEAHARGMKVILDLPLNDTSNRHPYYQQTEQAGEKSHYWGFYERNAGGKATHYFNWKNLPNLDYDSAEVRLLATEAAAYWIRVADVDGFRCDAAWGVQERAPDFWAQWRAELQRIRPDLLLLAESTARQDWPSVAGFSAAYDWSEQLGTWAWDRAFTSRQRVCSRLASALGEPDGSRPFRFLENNDTGARFVTRYGPQMTRAAAATLLSLPGLPCIYTGQEIGAEYQPYRREAPLDWSEDPNELEPYYRTLIEQRLADPALASGSLQLLDATPAAKVLAYSVIAPTSATLIAVNYSEREVSATVDAGPQWGGSHMLDVPAWSAVRLAAG
jgi:cyclomaltodextrinase / maltogenic alpha-amylase / neopullulanase